MRLRIIAMDPPSEIEAIADEPEPANPPLLVRT